MSGESSLSIDARRVLCILPDAQWASLRAEWAARAPGIQFEHTESGESGLARLGELRPALVIVGMSVEDMEGLEFLACTMSRYKDYRGKVIVLPGDGDPFTPVAHFRDTQTGRSVTEELEPGGVANLIAALMPPPPPIAGAPPKVAVAKAKAADPAARKPRTDTPAPVPAKADPVPAKADPVPAKAAAAPIRPSPIRALVLGVQPNAQRVNPPSVPRQPVAAAVPPPPSPTTAIAVAEPRATSAATPKAPSDAAPPATPSPVAPNAPAGVPEREPMISATALPRESERRIPTPAFAHEPEYPTAQPLALPESESALPHAASIDAPSGALRSDDPTPALASVGRAARKRPIALVAAGGATLLLVLAFGARHCVNGAGGAGVSASARVPPRAQSVTHDLETAAAHPSAAPSRTDTTSPQATPSPSDPGSTDPSFDPKALTTVPLSFQRGRADFTVDDQRSLDALVRAFGRALDRNPKARLEVGGHTSSEGTPAVNHALGRERALLARRYLTEHSIPEDRTAIVNYSATLPARAGSNLEVNRRVTLRIVE